MKKFFLLCSLVGLVNCTTQTEEKPAGLIPPEKMTTLLADIHLAETQVETMSLHPDTAKAVFNKLQKEIFLKRNVPKKEFDRSYKYYQDHIVQLDKIYEALVDTLGMREIKMSSK